MTNIKFLNKIINSLYLIGLLVFINIYLAGKASKLSQCCDVQSYINDSFNIFGGKIDTSTLHNYGYPTFIKVISYLGAKTNYKIAVMSVSLLLISALLFAKTCKKYFMIKNNYLYSTVLVFCIPISYGFSGFFLTEAITPILFFLLLNLIVITYFNSSTNTKTIEYLLIIAISSFTWMVRPAYLWLPFFLIFWLNLTDKTNLANILKKLALGLVTIIIIALPQYISVTTQPTKYSRPILDGVLRLNLAQGQTEWSKNIYRYATNVSSCGTQSLNFSPNNLTIGQATNENYSYNIFEMFKTYLLHIVSGWDALPGPSYIQSISYFPWIFVTIFSGFFIASPIVLLFLLFSKRANLQNTERKFAFTLLALFLASQIVLLNTATEFRFNIFGWMVSGLIWIFLIAVLKVNLKTKPTVILILILTLTVVTIGQYTLNLSDVWRNCV